MATKIGKIVRREVTLPDGRCAIVSMTGHGIAIRTKGRRGKSEILIDWPRLFGMGQVQRPRVKPTREPDRLERAKVERPPVPVKTCSSPEEHHWGPWKTGGMGRSRRCQQCGRLQIEN